MNRFTFPFYLRRFAPGLAATFVALFGSLESPAQGAAAPDPQMQAVLDKLSSLGGKPIETLSPEEARKQPSPADAVMALMKEQGKTPDPVDTEDTKIDLGDHSVKVRVYTPKGDGPFPVILYIHGGGWVIADLDTYDASPRALCLGTGAIVVSTEYRHAPEHKYPAAHQDVFGVYEALVKNEWKRKYDTKRIAVVGESAGGNMALSVAMMAKEKKLPLPVYQVLVYPVADLTGMPTPSKDEFTTTKPLNTPMLVWFAKYLLKSPEDAKDPNLSHLLAPAEMHQGLPPATIILAQIDPLRSEGEMLAKALQEAGVKVNLKTYEGVTHEFFGMGSVVGKAKEAETMVIEDLKTALGATPVAK